MGWLKDAHVFEFEHVSMGYLSHVTSRAKVDNGLVMISWPIDLPAWRILAEAQLHGTINGYHLLQVASPLPLPSRCCQAGRR